MVDSGHITVDVELADAADDNGVAAQKVVSEFTPATLPVGGYSITSTSVTGTASFTLVIYGT